MSTVTTYPSKRVHYAIERMKDYDGEWEDYTEGSSLASLAFECRQLRRDNAMDEGGFQYRLVEVTTYREAIRSELENAP